MKLYYPSLLFSVAALMATEGCTDSAGPSAAPTPPARVESFGPLSASVVAQSVGPFAQSAAPAATPTTAPLTIDSASARVRAILPGATIVAAKVDAERSLPTWKVAARLTSGARVEFEMLQSNGLIVTIEGEMGPFDYDLTPGSGILTFASARAAALGVQAGTIVQWELELEENDRWEYEFYIRDAQGALWEVELDAKSGRVLERKSKRGSGRDSAGDRGDDDDDTLSIGAIPDSIRQRVTAMVSGATLREVKAERDNDVHLWELAFQTAQGRKIEIKVLVADGTLFEVEGDDPPGTANVAPGNGLIDLTTALGIATAARAGTVDEWELSRNSENQFEWRFYIEVPNGGKYIARVNATTRAVTVILDDDDDDDDNGN
jgi:uncharacterized membrane protein YkoI